MTCRDVRVLLPDYALELLDEADERAVRDHLDTQCHACAGELDELLRVRDTLVHGAPAVAPPARLRAAVLDQIDNAAAATAAPTSTVPLAGAERPTRAWIRYAAIGGVAAAAALLATVRLGAPEPGEAGADPAAVWRERLADTDRRLNAPRFRVVSLMSASAGSTTITHLLYDELSAQLHAWARSDGDADRGAAPRRVWLLDSTDMVVASAALRDTGQRSVAVIDVAPSELRRAATLLLTRETDADPERPSSDRLERIAL